MEKRLLSSFFGKSPIPYAYKKILLNEQGIPCDYEIIDVNEAMATIVGKKASDMVGKRFREVFKDVDSQRIEQWIQQCGDVALNNKTISVDLQAAFPGKHLSAKLFMLDKYYFATILVDGLQDELPTNTVDEFIRSNLDMLCVFTMAGQIIKVNTAFETLLGFASAEMEGENVVSLIHGEDVDETLAAVQELNEQKPVVAFINRCRHKDGAYKDIEWRAEFTGNYIFSSARDITAMKTMERELKQQNEALTRLAQKLQANNDKLQSISDKDELTGLYNRHFFDEKVTVEMERADRYNEPLSLILFDLDYFKRMNDTFGHPVGDEVLKQMAQIVGKSIRTSDILVRFGGEEFLVLMPQTTIDGAMLVAEKLREAIAEYVHPQTGNLTASFGVAERFQSESFTSWYKRTDESLYQAKNNGRNCVFCYAKDTMPVATLNIQWRKEWESGNRVIDDQHRELLILANHLVELSLASLAQEVTQQKVEAQLDRLLEHLVYHFEQERQVLVGIGYPEAVHHAEVHNALTAKVQQFRVRYQQGELRPSAFYSFIIDDVVIGHMLRDDVLFFPYTAQKLN